jgi:hypothetical protein
MLRNCSVGTGAGIAGFGGNALAKKPAGKQMVKQLEKAPEVRSILRDLGLKRIPNANSAETMELSAESFYFTATEIDFGFGDLLVGDVNGDISAAFSFADVSSVSTPSGRYDDIPAGSEAWLYGSDSGTTFLRTATDSERAAALDAVSVNDVESVIVYTRSDLTGLRVDVTDPEVAGVDASQYELDRQYDPATVEATDAPTNEFVRFEITPDTAEAQSLSVESAEFQAASISGAARVVAQKVATSLGLASLGALTDSCEVKAIGCLASFVGSIGGCLKCAPACLGSPTGIGAVICVLCVFGVCSYLISGISCANALNCFSNA